MTKRRVPLYLLALLVPLLVASALASCSKLTVEPTSAGIPAGSVMGEVTTAGIAEPDSDDSIVGMPLRTIAPATLTVAELANAQNYTLKIRGKSRSNTLPEQVVQLNADGTFLIPSLTYGVWELTLAVYSGTSTNIQLTGSTSVTVDGSRGATARFVLTTRGVAGTGTLSLALTWSEEDRSYAQASYPTQLTVALALYCPGTDVMVPNSRAIWTRSNTNTSRIGTDLSYTGFRNTTQSPQLAAGEYELRFTITGGNVPDGVTLEWRDNLYIEPGRETRQNITIPRMAIVARAPTGFAGTATALSAAAPGQYAGTLTWQDVYNANRYELEVMRYTTGTAHPAGDAAWTAAQGNAGSVTHAYNAIPGDADSYTAVVAGRPRVTGGSLLGGGGTVTLAMEIAGGESYAARLRAVGYLGPSDWVYLQAPLVPDPVAPASFSAAPSSIDIAGGTSTFPVSLAWNGGYVDAGGTWELQVLTFTGGTAPLNDGAWGSATGRREYSYTSANYAPAGTPATRAAGGLEPTSKGLELSLQDTADYYMARIRGRNSSGATTGWKYLSSVMIPQPAIVGDTPTQATRWTYAGSTRVQVWDVLMSIWGPQAGSNLRMEWLRCVVRNQEDADLDDAAWSYLAGLSANTGSNGKSVWIKGAGTNNMVDMNKGSTFFFRIRTETPYGNSAWYYYPVEVAAAP